MQIGLRDGAEPGLDFQLSVQTEPGRQVIVTQALELVKMQELAMACSLNDEGFFAQDSSSRW
jgi:hypothetical protein